MKRIIAFAFSMLVCVLSARAGETISLDGRWDLSFWPQPSKAVRAPEDIPSSAKTIAATVPGNVEIDLQAAGLIKDPTLGRNVYDLRNWEGHQWCYTRHFATPSLSDGQTLRLDFGGIDCLADVWLNGHLLGSPDNMLIEHRFDITDLVKKGGDNELKVIIRSVIMEAHSDPYVAGTISWRNVEQLNYRKPAHMFGWDIMPRIVSAGLWRSVTLEVRDPIGFENVSWLTGRVDVDKKEATVFVEYKMRFPFECYDKYSTRVRLSKDGKELFSMTKPLLYYFEKHDLDLKNVDFWWPRGYGDPVLYDATVEILDPQGKVVATDSRKLGIRTIKLDHSDINLPPDHPGDFCFVVNGERVFIRGTNWVPLDGLHSRDASHLKQTIDLAVELNCNMIRCWGGNVYEDDAFFDLCDQNGIMVWQDFSMANTQYPQNDDFAARLEEEVRSLVLKLRSHASLALWCGNNESDRVLSETLRPFHIDPGADRITRIVIPRVLYEYDPSRTYLPSSPYYSPEIYSRNMASDFEKYLPQDHLWGARGYYKTPFYNQPASLYVSEIGYHGCPNIETLKKMFSPDKVYPWVDDNYKWNDEWQCKAVMWSPFDEAHEDRNNIMTTQMSLLFGAVPKDLESFVFGSQAVQAEALKYFVELWRGRKGEKNGIMWWNLKEGWPIISDGVVDYYFSKKLSFYFLKNAQFNVCAMINDPVDGKYPLVVVNDTRKDASGNVTVSDVESGRKLYDGSFKVDANGRSVAASIPEQSGQGMLLVKYTVDGKNYVNHYLYGEPPFDMKRYKALLEKTGIYDDILKNYTVK